MVSIYSQKKKKKNYMARTKQRLPPGQLTYPKPFYNRKLLRRYFKR